MSSLQNLALGDDGKPAGGGVHRRVNGHRQPHTAAPPTDGDSRITIINQTALRIAIDPSSLDANPGNPTGGRLILPSFGQQRIEARTFAYQPWERLGLIRSVTPRQRSPHSKEDTSAASWPLALLWLLPLALLIGAVALLLTRFWALLPLDGYLLLAAVLLVIALVSGCVLQHMLKKADNESWLRRCWIGLRRCWSMLITCLMLWRRIPAIWLVSLIVPLVAILLSPQRADSPHVSNGPLRNLFLLISDPMEFFSGLTNNPIEVVLRFCFVAIASMLPALLLYLFHSQRLNTLREGFTRDVIRLNPNILTRRDVQILYGSLMNDILGKTPGVIHGLAQLPVLISTFLFALGWSLTLIVNQVGAENGELFGPYRSALIFGFLGAYFFAINTIFRRYVRADLNTKAYTHMAVRVLVTFVLIWVISVLLQSEGDANSTAASGQASATATTVAAPTTDAPPAATPQPDAASTTPETEPPVTPAADLSLVVLYLLAFFVGIIPETATAVMQDFLRSQSWVGRFIPSLQEQHPLHKLDGITLYDQARLLEEGVENIETLAHHNLIELMLRTRIPAPRLVDLVDQAILYLHARGPIQAGKAVSSAEESEDGLLYRLGTCGIRTATDLALMYKMLPENQGAEHKGDYKPNPALVAQFGEQEEQLRLILQALEDDEWMVYLLHWREMRQAGRYTYRLQDFVDRFMKLPGAARWHDQPVPADAGAASGQASVDPSSITKPAGGNGHPPADAAGDQASAERPATPPRAEELSVGAPVSDVAMVAEDAPDRHKV